MAYVFQLTGFAAAIIVAIGYLPQIVHLSRERCAAGVSIKAWSLWLLSSLLTFSYAFSVFDVVFVTLQTINLLATVTVVVLAKRYQKTCLRCRTGSDNPVKIR